MGLLTTLFGEVGEKDGGRDRRSLENPSTPLSAPDDWLFDSLGSFRASSGVNVNRETALTYDAYWRCVALISGDVAKLPLCVYKRGKTNEGQKTKTEDEDHPAYRLLHFEACPGEVSALHFKRTLTMHALTEGNGYAYIIRDGAGRPLEMWPLSPMKTYPIRENSRLWYVTEFGTNTDKLQRKLPAEDVFHIKGLSFDGLVGYSAVAKMREALGLGLAYENFGSIYFRNNARPNVVLKHPGRLRPEAKTNLRESWERLHSGLENANRTAVLEEGMDIATISINARDSQLLEGKSFSRTVICNFFGVPSHKVSENKSVSYNSLEQENESYVEDGGGLGFWLPAWMDECWRKLLTEEEKAKLSHFFHFKTRHLLKANITARTQYYTALVDRGILSPDEVREEEGWNPRADGEGGHYTHAANMVVEGEEPPPVATVATPPAPDGDVKKQEPPQLEDKRPKKKKDDAERIAPEAAQALADAAGRMLRRLRHKAERAASKPHEFIAWIEALDRELPLLEEGVGAAARLCLQSPAAVSRLLLAEVRCTLLEASQCLACDLAKRVAQEMRALEKEYPRQFRSKKPTRSIDEALNILKRLPDVKKGQVAVLLPYEEEPKYDVEPADLKDLPKEYVKVHELVATQPTVGRDEVAAMIQGSLLGGHRGEPMPEGFPDDRPYVVEGKGKLYIHNGHHRTTAGQLLGLTKIEAYFYKDK